MVESFIDLEHMEEYWGNTICWYEGDLRSMYDWCTRFDDNDEPYLSVNTYDGNSEDSVYIHEGSYDGVISHLKPYFPGTHYIQSRDDQCILIKLVKPQHYKRSFDWQRYRAFRPVLHGRHIELLEHSCDNKLILNPGHYMSWELALERANINDAAAINEDWAVLRGSPYLLCFRGTPVARVADSGGVFIHPLYLDHFGPEVRKFAEVTNV